MAINNITNNQYSIPSIVSTKSLNKETTVNSANTMPIINRPILEPNVLRKSSNDSYPNFIRKVYNNQFLWDNRQTQKVYDSFADIWGIEKLWTTIDRANLNFPIRPNFEYEGFIHWDYDPDTKPQNVQGVLALSDQSDQNMGGFQCIPWLYRNYDSWKLTQPIDRDKFKPNIEGLEDKLVKVSLEAGDLLIFNSTLPHGIRPNNSKDKVRIAQYISMMPAQEDDKDLVSWRINSWKNRVAPQGYAFPGDPRNWEQTKYKTANLTELGKKILGLDKW